MVPITYKDLLTEFIKFKSISTDPQYEQEVIKTANWLNDLFKKHNFKSQVINGYDNPIVVASLEVNPEYETCLIYGHYDVQPAAVEDGWDFDPFELAEQDNRYFARGVVDNKGQVMIHIYTVLKLLETNSLKYNVKFLIEGNEETGSPKLSQFLQDHKDLLSADFALISDGELTSGHPTIEVGFRGIFNTTVSIETSTNDLHSGLYGGTVPNAAHELLSLLNLVMTKEGYITIPEFFDDVVVDVEKAIEQNSKIPFTLEEFKKVTGVYALFTENGYDFYSQLGLRPSAEVTGILTGYCGQGYKNSIPSKATAKVNFRLVASQDPEKHARIFEEFVLKNVPSYVKATVVCDQMSRGVNINPDNKYIERAKPILEHSFKNSVLVKHCGATLPIVADFNDLLQIPQVLAPLSNEDCRMHAANENYDLEYLNNALEFSSKFLSMDSN